MAICFYSPPHVVYALRMRSIKRKTKYYACVSQTWRHISCSAASLKLDFPLSVFHFKNISLYWQRLARYGQRVNWNLTQHTCWTLQNTKQYNNGQTKETDLRHFRGFTRRMTFPYKSLLISNKHIFNMSLKFNSWRREIFTIHHSLH